MGCARLFLSSVVVSILLGLGTRAIAEPANVEHAPAAHTFGEPLDITQREPALPREDELVTLFFRVSFQFTYDRVAVYYTNDGFAPSGAFGVPFGSTQVMTNTGGQVTFVRNENTPEGVRDWWKVTLPISTRGYNQTIRYTMGAWSTSGGSEIQAATGGNGFIYINKLAWPGAGAGSPNPAAGYPPVSFWKEEAVVGNNYINVQIDQNGTIYDVYYPGAGAVQGVATKNEGYANGNDTFPPLTSGRGQMHANQYMGGVRVDGTTYWFSNQNALGYTDITQVYHPTSNSTVSSRRLNANGNNILITQYDFSPKLENGPLGYPQYTENATQKPNRGLHVQRCILLNQGPTTKDVNFYYYGDWAINGGDGQDGAYLDGFAISGMPINAMIAYDNANLTANQRGEYNPTFFPDYNKAVSVFLGAAMKLCFTVGGSAGSSATDAWSDTSGDTGQGWIGRKVTLAPNTPVEIDILIAGGFRNSPNQADVGDVQIRPAAAWFFANSMQDAHGQTDAYWTNWLNTGVTVDTPDPVYDALMNRGLLATALHADGASGAIIAGFHNGAYPFCWPRDAVYAAVCLARTGHLAESSAVYSWMRDTAYRDNESWGKGFWKQKYTTDGYTIWSSPQIDETAVFPWGVYYHYLVTGDAAFLSSHYASVRDAAFTMSSNPGDNSLLPFLNYNATERLMWSNNVWEDSYNFFIYSNANVVRGLRDAASIAAIQGQAGDAADFTNRANTIKGGLDDRLNANREQTDISQLGIVYPFKVYSPVDPLAVKYIDRVNGIHPDESGQNHPLINFTNRYNWLDLINRYHCDGYWGNNCTPAGQASTPWGAGPWFLSTLWYGLYYAERQDFTAGKGDIDNHKYRIDLSIAKLGPAGLGAEQIAPYCSDNCPATDCPNCGSLQYPGQGDFTLQTAWPNAWESMSTFVDAIMAFIDYTPDAPNNTIRIAPKLPTAWTTMTFRNLPLAGKKVSVTVNETSQYVQTLATNELGGAVNVASTMRIPVTPGVVALIAIRDGAPTAFSSNNPAVGSYEVTAPLSVGPSSTTDLRVYFGRRGDCSGNGVVDVADIPCFVSVLLGNNSDAVQRAYADLNADASPDGRDIAAFVDAIVP